MGLAAGIAGGMLVWQRATKKQRDDHWLDSAGNPGTALVTGAHAANNILALIRGRAQRPLSYAYYGQGIALGLRDAVGFGAFPDDVPGRLIVRRMAAVRLRTFFLWFLTFALELERRFPGFFFWVGKRRYEKAFVSKVVDCAGEAGETEVWLDFSKDFGYISNEQHKDLTERYEEVNRVLYGMSDKPHKFCLS